MSSNAMQTVYPGLLQRHAQDLETTGTYCGYHVADISAVIVRAVEAPEDLIAGEVFNAGAD